MKSLKYLGLLALVLMANARSYGTAPARTVITPVAAVPAATVTAPVITARTTASVTPMVGSWFGSH